MCSFCVLVMIADQTFVMVGIQSRSEYDGDDLRADCTESIILIFFTKDWIINYLDANDLRLVADNANNVVKKDPVIIFHCSEVIFMNVSLHAIG